MNIINHFTGITSFVLYHRLAYHYLTADQSIYLSIYLSSFVISKIGCIIMVLSRSEFSFIRYPHYSADRGCSWSRFFKLIPLQNFPY